MLVGINVPIQVGEAVCMPGDVVLGTEAGIIFVPAHLAETCVIDAEKTHVRDIFGFQRLHEGKYSAAQIDSAWELCMWEDFAEWFPVAPESEEYRHLDFTEELENARKGGVSSPAVLLPRVRARRPAGKYIINRTIGRKPCCVTFNPAAVFAAGFFPFSIV